jgi:hypothetical protein
MTGWERSPLGDFGIILAIVWSFLWPLALVLGPLILYALAY